MTRVAAFIHVFFWGAVGCVVSGRTAMLAVAGWFTQLYYHPLYDGKLSSNPLEALGQVPPLAW
jgi:hypothetical protein